MSKMTQRATFSQRETFQTECVINMVVQQENVFSLNNTVKIKCLLNSCSKLQTASFNE